MWEWAQQLVQSAMADFARAETASLLNDASIWRNRALTAEQECAKLREEYNELLYAVARKWPNETRHQTALRYIREAESHSCEGARALADTGVKL